MNETIDVLIIEDDFRVAEINRRHVENEEEYRVIHVAKTGKEALTYLAQCHSLPQLVLLDIYIPDVNGMELFWQIRKDYYEIDILAVTAANEAETIEQAIRGGVFDYIIKPVDAKRLQKSLKEYKAYRSFFTAKETLTQYEVDALTGIGGPKPSREQRKAALPKGIDPITLADIQEVLDKYQTRGITAVELSKQIGTSRSTARRYLEYLVSTNEAYTSLKYGTVGRPEREYFPSETYEQNE